MILIVFKHNTQALIFAPQLIILEGRIRIFYDFWQALNDDVKNSIKDLKSNSAAHTLEDCLLHLFEIADVKMPASDHARAAKSGIKPGINGIGTMIKAVTDNLLVFFA